MRYGPLFSAQATLIYDVSMPADSTTLTIYQFSYEWITINAVIGYGAGRESYETADWARDKMAL